MKLHYAISCITRQPHLVLKLEHIAKTRRDLREEIAEAGGLEKLNRDYIDGIEHVLDTLEGAMINGRT